jgi:hypothetical protein
MSNYIGNQPSAGEFKKLDSIASSFNGSLTQFDLDYSTVNQSVGDATQLIVSLNGIIQEPGIAYTLGIGGGSIVFASAPASGDTCHIVLLGGVGGTATPSDGSVDASKLVANLKDYLEDEYVANGSQTTYTLTRAVTGTNQILLTIDGIVQPTSAYSISGTTLTISPALPNTTNVRVVHMGIAGAFNAANSITSTMLSPTGGTANQVLAVNASANGIEFQTASSGGGGAWEVIGRVVPTSTVASVTFDNLDDTYAELKLFWNQNFSSNTSNGPTIKFYDGSTQLNGFIQRRRANNNNSNVTGRSKQDLLYHTNSTFFKSEITIFGMGRTNEPLVSVAYSVTDNDNSWLRSGVFRAATSGVTPNKLILSSSWSQIQVGTEITLYGLKKS